MDILREKTCPSATLSTTKPIQTTGLGSKPDVVGKRPTVRANRGTDRITGRIHSTLCFFCFPVGLRIGELCKQPPKLMVHLYLTQKSGIREVLTQRLHGAVLWYTATHLISSKTFEPEMSVLTFNTHHNTYGSEIEPAYTTDMLGQFGLHHDAHSDTNLLITQKVYDSGTWNQQLKVPDLLIRLSCHRSMAHYEGWRWRCGLSTQRVATNTDLE
jgi:hypothetical protein